MVVLVGVRYQHMSSFVRHLLPSAAHALLFRLISNEQEKGGGSPTMSCRITDYLSSQVPTIYEVSVHEKNFAIRVEEVLSNITFPEYRQAIVEVLTQPLVL